MLPKLDAERKVQLQKNGKHTILDVNDEFSFNGRNCIGKIAARKKDAMQLAQVAADGFSESSTYQYGTGVKTYVD